MTKSALQIARAAYQPKLPKALRGNVKAVAGEPTQSVADQEEIKKLFPNTYGMPLIKFENTDEAADGAAEFCCASMSVVSYDNVVVFGEEHQNNPESSFDDILNDLNIARK